MRRAACEHVARVRRLACAAVLAVLPLGQARASEAFTTYGDVTRYALPAAASILALSRNDRDGFEQLLASGAITLGATYALKHAIDDRRPNGGRRSFPSGHTAWAFAGAAFIQHRYGWQLGMPAELAAAAVAVSRIDGGYHRWRDVIASAVIAHGSAFFLVDRLGGRVMLMPMPMRQGRGGAAVGIAAHVRF